MPSNAEYVTVDRAAKLFDLTPAMLYHLVGAGRVRTRPATDDRPRLALEDLRDVANRLDRRGWEALRAEAAGLTMPEAWQREVDLIERRWSGHTTEGVWQQERDGWTRMGRVVRASNSPGSRGGPGRGGGERRR